MYFLYEEATLRNRWRLFWHCTLKLHQRAEIRFRQTFDLQYKWWGKEGELTIPWFSKLEATGCYTCYQKEKNACSSSVDSAKELER